MRAFERVKIVRESWDKAIQAGRYNPALEARVTLRDRSYILPLDAGSSDTVDVFREDDRLILVSVNDRMEYAGIQVYDLEDGGEIGNVFVQSEHEARDMIGRRGFDYAPRTIAARLLEYVS